MWFALDEGDGVRRRLSHRRRWATRTVAGSVQTGTGQHAVEIDDAGAVRKSFAGPASEVVCDPARGQPIGARQAGDDTKARVVLARFALVFGVGCAGWQQAGWI